MMSDCLLMSLDCIISCVCFIRLCNDQWIYRICGCNTRVCNTDIRVYHIDGLEQHSSISITTALELLQSLALRHYSALCYVISVCDNETLFYHMMWMWYQTVIMRIDFFHMIWLFYIKLCNDEPRPYHLMWEFTVRVHRPISLDSLRVAHPIVHDILPLCEPYPAWHNPGASFVP